MILDMEPGGFPGVCIVTIHIQCKCVSVTFCSRNYKLVFVSSEYLIILPCLAVHDKYEGMKNTYFTVLT